MNLEQLQQAMEAAAAKAAEKPEDEALKAAAEEAKQAYEAAKAAADGDDKDDDSDIDDSELDAKTKAYIEKLRKESAKHRVRAKEASSKLKAEEEKRKAILKAAGIETEDDEPAEVKLKKSQEQTTDLQFRNAILETAVAHEVPSGSVKYFQYLMSEAVNELEDGEELSDDKLAEIVAEAKAKGGSKGKANTSVGGKGGAGGTPNPKAGNNVVTLDQFVRMSMTEKSELYTKNQELYTKLVNEAKAKKKLV